MKDGMVILVYVDDCIIVGKDMGEIDGFVKSMQQGSENFVLTDEGSIDKFLGIEIKRLGKQEFEISQPFLIDRILALLQLEHNGHEMESNDKLTPAAPQILNKDLMGKPRRNPGSIELRLECYPIFKVILAQISPCLFIKRHVSATIRNCVTNKRLLALDDTY
jgi:hypothetical protein